MIEIMNVLKRELFFFSECCNKEVLKKLMVGVDLNVFKFNVFI